jgi:ABC-type dipeptide/oligopeptide/nickel transport system ATPase subunit
MRIETQGLKKTYRQGRRTVHALRSASIRVEAGETVGLWGHSGSGKSTLAKLICGIEPADCGRVLFDGVAIRFPYPRSVYQHVQMIIQHPETSFNPRLTLERSLMEPYICHHIPISRDALLTAMHSYGLYEEHLARYPSELSGGELQRAAIVRALSMKPALMVLDEPTSMLDSISQAQIMRMLERIQQEQGASLLLISHSSALLNTFCHRIYEVNDGTVTERGE